MAINRKVLDWVGLSAILMGSGGGAVAESQADIGLSEAEQSAVFLAAGATQRTGMWVLCTDDPNPTGAQIDTVGDLNGDGLPEAVVTEGGMFCYGHTGTGFTLLSKQGDGSWRVMAGSPGVPEFLKNAGADGWPDISVGGPGFCFPVQRWNGTEYTLHRFEYEGKPCEPSR